MEIKEEANLIQDELDAPIINMLPIQAKAINNEIAYNLGKILKRAMDIIGSIVGILFLIPLTIFLYIANLITKDSGPVFYKQERIGKDGQTFKMYKYRSMVIGAEEKLKEYLEENEEARIEYKKYHKLTNDPRITKIGKFIRKTSIDEFPQFINILKGEMSLVGPRPYLPRERGEMNGYFQYITELKPGLTGFWQISGRSGVTFNDRVHMDMYYYNNGTFKTDLKILFKTVEKAVKKEGAK